MKAIVDSCYIAGIRVFEFMNRADNAFKLFNELSAYVAVALPGMKLAVGTICDPGTALRYIDAGASIIIAPNINPIIGRICKKKIYRGSQEYSHPRSYTWQKIVVLL